MCVRNPPTFAPSRLHGTWGLVENRPALLRVVAPPGAPPRRRVASSNPRRPNPAGPRARCLGVGWGLSLCWRISDTVD